MAIRQFDEIYIPLEKEGQDKVLAIRKFFEEMNLPGGEIERRIALAYDLESTFWLIFAMINVLLTDGEPITEEYVEYFAQYGQNGYREALDTHNFYRDKDFVNNRIAETVIGVINRTIANPTEYSLSVDRAVTIAETETNVIGNFAEFTDAKDEGYTKKVWETMQDEAVRQTHVEADGSEIDIDEPFLVGGYEMMFPCDSSLGAGAEEIVNCRCTVSYR